MLTLPPTVRIYIAKQPVNMRKSFNGLAGVVREQLDLDPLSGHLFCFFNRRKTLMKLLFYDSTGFSIFYKRLAQGTFQLPDFHPEQLTTTVSPATLAMIFDGIDLSTIKQRHRYRRELDEAPTLT